MVPSVHFLIRQAARERLAAIRTLNEVEKARHQAMAELYLLRASQLQASQAHSPADPDAGGEDAEIRAV